ncbi:MAG: methyltransferase family protein [Rickettsiaceae bacterium]|jgi:hypothetical protein|nr:methyltransferase family protein [Burkholderiales bacterium]MCE3232760.1 methyltransferase family protein [Rickettsiaceae bacterium]
MNWKFKSLAFNVFQTMPFGDYAYDTVQKYITKRFRRQYFPIGETAKYFISNTKNLLSNYKGDVSKAVYYEFGAGRDLYSNFINYCCGIQNQIVVDINPLVRKELVNGLIEELKSALSLPSELIRKPERLITGDLIAQLKDLYGIEYMAPMDAANIKIPNKSINMIATTDTLEHIPANDLRNILARCRELCSDDAIISMQVDYSDHYSHSDTNINPYNFLQYGDKEWRLYNPSMHYQNRLRHSDYIKLFEQTGFKIVEERSFAPNEAFVLLDSVNLDNKFKGYEKDDLLKTRGEFVLIPG